MPLLLFLITLPPYPFVHEAMDENGKWACYNMVYKNGCKETRTGRLTLGITLDAEGHVVIANTVSNTIKRDPKQVERCVMKNIKKWVFKPPQDVEPSFEMTLIYGDKC